MSAKFYRLLFKYILADLYSAKIKNTKNYIRYDIIDDEDVTMSYRVNKNSGIWSVYSVLEAKWINIKDYTIMHLCISYLKYKGYDA
jgi:hypothetical protein